MRADAHVTATLAGSAALDLGVTHASGAALGVYGLDLRMDGVQFLPNGYSVEFDAATDADGRIGGLLPGDYTLSVRAGGLERIVVVNGLAAGEVRNLPVPLAQAPSVRGVVLGSSGAPVEGVLIRAALPASIGDSADCAILNDHILSTAPERVRLEVARTTTDEMGAFHLPFSDEPWHIVVVGERPGFLVESAPVGAAEVASIRWMQRREPSR